MPSQARGVDISVSWYEEATFRDESGLTTGIKIYPTKFGMTPKQNLFDSNTLNGAERSRSAPAQGKINVDGVIGIEVSAESLGIILKHLFGGVATTGSGPYVHTYTIDDLPVGLTVEKGNGSTIVGSGAFERFNGCKINSMEFDFPQE